MKKGLALLLAGALTMVPLTVSAADYYSSRAEERSADAYESREYDERAYNDRSYYGSCYDSYEAQTCTPYTSRRGCHGYGGCGYGYRY